MKDKYVFPAIFDYSEPPGPSISFPDFPGCLSEADDDEQAIEMARSALSGRLYALEKGNENIPAPTDTATLISRLEPSQTVVPVDVNMALYHKLHAKPRNINKMCTIPEWLSDEAKSQGLNFSQTLQDALMEKLGITTEHKRRKSR